MPEFVDMRDFVLSGQVKPKKQAVYIERLNGWYTLQELMGDEKGDVLNNSINQKTSKVDIKLMYAELFVRSLRYPDPEALPTEPKPPAPIDEHVSDAEQTTYSKALAKYERDADAYPHPYPTDHPKAGELVFRPLDRDPINKAIPGEILERVAELAMPLNGFTKDDLDQKKVNSTGTVVDSSLSNSPSS